MANTRKSLNAVVKPSADIRRIAATFCCLMSAAGFGLGIYLTILKFRMSYTPCMTPHGGCQIGTMSCDDALSSTWSMFMDLPVSLWGSAFYLATGVLAATIAVRREPFGGTAAHLLLPLAGIAVLISVFLGAITYFTLESACPYCASLYAVSLLLFGGAFITRNPPGVQIPSASEVVRQHTADLLDALFWLALVFIVATGVQSMLYHGMRHNVDTQDGCPVQEESLPATSIKMGVEQPKVIIALFIDMTCRLCRKEFKALASALRDGQFPEPVQLWIYHTPRHVCDPAAFPSSYAKTDDSARDDNACLAALAAECIEKLQPGQGGNLIAGMFPLQDAREKDVPLFTAERIGNRAVELGMEIDPDDPENPLFQCINNDKSVLDRITEHQRFAEGPNYKVPTVAVFRASQGRPDPSVKPLFGDANTPLDAVFEFATRQAVAETQP